MVRLDITRNNLPAEVHCSSSSRLDQEVVTKIAKGIFDPSSCDFTNEMWLQAVETRLDCFNFARICSIVKPVLKDKDDAIYYLEHLRYLAKDLRFVDF
jgi:hypothetical protein